jgi:hypothetical protein
MGLFNLFKNNGNGSSMNETVEANSIPKELFIEEKDPQNLISSNTTNGSTRGIEAIYSFLQADYETKGYNDALTNPDDSYKADNILLIRQDLEILILQVKTYYEDNINKLEFHINSRSRAGLVDLVEELKITKDTVQEHLKKVDTLNEDLEQNTGITQRIALSYQRGFSHGLSALTQSQILNKSI